MMQFIKYLRMFNIFISIKLSLRQLSNLKHEYFYSQYLFSNTVWYIPRFIYPESLVNNISFISRSAILSGSLCTQIFTYCRKSKNTDITIVLSMHKLFANCSLKVINECNQHVAILLSISLVLFHVIYKDKF